MLSYFKDFSLRKKGLVLVSIVVLSLVCTVVFARSALSILKDHLIYTAEEALPQLEQISQTIGLLESAHLEVVRSSALANTGLTGPSLDRQFEKASTALASLQAFYEVAEDDEGTAATDGAGVENATEENATEEEAAEGSAANAEAVEPDSVVDVTRDRALAYISSAQEALMMLSIEPNAGTMMVNSSDDAFIDLISTAISAASKSRDSINDEALNSIEKAGHFGNIFLVISGISLALCVLSTVSIIRSITGPVKQMTDNMRELAGGNLEIEITGTNAANEIGKMASALAVFRDNAVESEKLRHAREQARLDQARVEKDALEAKEARAVEEAARIKEEKALADHRAAESRTLEEELSFVIGAAENGDFSKRITSDFDQNSLNDVKKGVNSLLSTFEVGLEAASSVFQDLAGGDLATRMNGDFRGAFAKLQKETNFSAENFEQAIIQIAGSASEILNNSSEIATSADSLSTRTERTAANLEETSAALDNLTMSIASAAKGAEKANLLVKTSMEKARLSESVVQDAIQAMDLIADFSTRISETINVIDKIAFQTNLLALNAGVEAARAGESGRGFIVVASEVRALAVQAAESANKIGDMIGRSSQEVSKGVGLVAQTGETIREMLASIDEAAEHVAEIAEAAAQQANGLAGINSSISTIDQATQQNAAMFEETTAASQSLATAAKGLTRLAGKFKVGDQVGSDPQATEFRQAS